MNSSSYFSSDDLNDTSSSLVSNFTLSFCYSSWSYLHYVSAIQWIKVSQIIIGAFLNSWLLISIFTSKDLRSRLRNIMLSSMCVQNLIESLVYLPFSVYFWSQYLQTIQLTCAQTVAFHLIFFSNELVSNWNLVLILALAVSTMLAMDISILNSSVFKILTYGVLLMPWLFCAVVVPAVLFDNYKHVDYMSPTYNITLCYIPKSTLNKFYVANIGVPAVLVVTLLTAFIFLTWKSRAKRRATTDMSRHLIGQSPEPDILLPYLLFVGIFFLCDFGFIMNLVDLNHCTAKYLRTTLNLLEGFRVYLLPLLFLLFPEIRHRAVEIVVRFIRPARSYDITMTYVKGI